MKYGNKDRRKRERERKRERKERSYVQRERKEDKRRREKEEEKKRKREKKEKKKKKRGGESVSLIQVCYHQSSLSFSSLGRRSPCDSSNRLVSCIMMYVVHQHLYPPLVPQDLKSYALISP